MSMRLYGITFILAGIILLIITIVSWLKYRSFRNCEVTKARVLSVDSAKHFSDDRSRTTFSMTLSYIIDGVAYERKLSCDGEEFRLGADRQVEIRYKARNPKHIILNAAEKQARGQRILWIITAVLFLIGAAMLLLSAS